MQRDGGPTADANIGRHRGDDAAQDGGFLAVAVVRADSHRYTLWLVVGVLLSNNGFGRLVIFLINVGCHLCLLITYRSSMDR